MKAGRNDTCPCGSGRKYKHCCLAAQARTEESQGDIVRQRIRRAFAGVPATLMQLVVENFGADAIDEAWDEFHCWDGEHEFYDPESPHIQMFLPWMFHRWAPDPHGTDVANAALHDRTPTSVFLERRGAQMDPTLRRYLEACLATPLSFFDITSCTPDQGFDVRDLLTGEEFPVLERSASRTLRKTEIIFAQIVRIDGIAILEAAPPCSLPPITAIDIADVRDKLRKVCGTIDAAALHDYDLELREIYLDIAEPLLNPQLPELRNTDGDPLVPHRLTFDVDSAEQAFLALKHLAVGVPDDELLARVVRDKRGQIRETEFDWLKLGNAKIKAYENTVLGSVNIKGNLLTCEVNSEKRAVAFRAIVEKALGAAARIRPTVITPIERQLEDLRAARRAGGRTAAKRDAEQEALMQMPEVQAKLKAMMAAHYEAWVDEPVPSLGDKTPRQAVRTKAGRVKVEALLRQIEYANAGPGMSAQVDASVIQRLRQELGLK